MKKGEILTVRVERFGAEGNSISRVDGFVVFVRGGIPGDTVSVRLMRVSKNFAEGEIVEVLEPSPLRTTPRCRYFGTCGGCSWQHLSYDGQLEFKRQQVVDALERIGGFDGLAVRQTIGSSSAYGYRNKMEFSFGIRWLTSRELADQDAGIGSGAAADRFGLGLHIPRRFDRVLDLEECHLQGGESPDIVNAVRAFCVEHQLAIYSTRTHTGYLRNLVVRTAERTGERMVNLVTSEERPEVNAAFQAMLLEQFPTLTTIVNNITTRKSQVALGDREVVLHGPGWITERIGRRTYQISANSFFQTNTAQAERLYDAVRDLAGITRTETVFDLYSGTGTIALHVADDAAEVVGIESVAAAVDDARSNAERNGVTNCRFLLGDLKERIVDDPAWLAAHAPPAVMIIDPPRAGMHPKIVERILQLCPPRIVYVSCNPATQARDVRILCDGGTYRIRAVQPVDMFPHTTHVENVLLLTTETVT